jgi:predicted dehydrogenase
MEAFMYRFHPLTERAVEVVETELGEVRSVTSAFTYRVPDGAEDIRLNPGLLGGSVLDVGTYAVDGREVTERFDPADHYRLEVEHFADCVESGETPRVDRTESVAQARVLDALVDSASEGRPVAVDDRQ